MNNNFVALNIIEGKNISLFPQPIVYYWDGNSELIDALKEKKFMDFISSKITTANYYETVIHMVYVYTDDEDNIFHNIKKFKISDIYDIDNFDLKRKYLWNVMNFLYVCAYKKDYENVFEFKKIYNALLSKYPKKITPTVVANFIESHLLEKYPNIKEGDVKLITEKFYNEIQE